MRHRLPAIALWLVACFALALGPGCSRRDPPRPDRGSLLDWAYHALSADFKASWSDGLTHVGVAANGDIEFTDDDTDVKSISPDGFLVIEEGTWLATRRFEAAPGPDGSVTHYFVAGGQARARDELAR